MYGNNNGTDSVPPHEISICHDHLNTSCVELPVVLVTPSVLEDIVTDLNISCEQTIEMATNISAPITEFNSIAISAPGEIIATANEPCDLCITSSLDRIILVRNDEFLEIGRASCRERV